MRFKFLAILMLLSTPLYAGVTSYDNTFTNNDIHSSTFAAKLNRNFQQSLTGGINNVETTNITNDTLTEADMADEINPRVRTYEGAACEFVYTGLLPVTDSDLTTDTSAGTAYPRGFRIRKSSSTAHTYTASKWTWVDIDQNGDFQYSELPIGSATPSVAANSIRLARVSTDGTTVSAVQDLRTTSCTSGPFSIIADATGESNLGDLLAYGNGGIKKGLTFASADATSVSIQPGSAYINGEYRTLETALSVPANTVGSSVAGTSGLDTGAIAPSTTYYLYAAADLDSVTPFTGIFSTSATSPTGVTNYRKLGEITTDASSSFASADATTVNSDGLIVQRKTYQTGLVQTGSTAIPSDSSIPQITEGDQYMSMKFTPTSATNKLRINVTAFTAAPSGVNHTCALFKDTTANALASGVAYSLANLISNINFNYEMPAGKTSEMTFSVRCGSSGAETTTFNGQSGAVIHGGVLTSSISVEEYRK